MRVGLPVKRRYLAVLAMVAFVLGVAIPTAFATNETSYYQIAGGSTSCSFVRASNDPGTLRAGGKTANFAGCASSTPANMPAGSLKVWGYVNPYSSPSTNCNYYHVKVTDVAASSIITTESIEKADAVCSIPNNFFSYMTGGRKLADGSWRTAWAQTLAYYWYYV